jgi:RNA polymerase sigma-70 factor (ECF subfamily)
MTAATFIYIHADRKQFLMPDPAVTMNTDENLMTAVASGDHEAFSILVKRYQGIIWRIARRYTGNDEDARDICQTVFLKLFDAGFRYRISATFRTYLFRITNNVCIDHYRKKRPEVDDSLETMDTAPLPNEMFDKNERNRQLQHALAQLPERQRSAIVLRYDADLPVKEIADSMHVSEKAVERLLAHAREALRGLVQKSAD